MRCAVCVRYACTCTDGSWRDAVAPSFRVVRETPRQQDEPTSKVGRATAHPRLSGHQCPNPIQTALSPNPKDKENG